MLINNFTEAFAPRGYKLAGFMTFNRQPLFRQEDRAEK